MIIKKYDMYSKQKHTRYSLLDKNNISNIYNITILFMLRFNQFQKYGVLNFIQKHPNGIYFEELNIDIDNKKNLVYLSESLHTYKNKRTNPEIEALLEEENFIQLCNIGFLDYIVMTKDNFIQLLLSWEKILNQLPEYALLYQEDTNCYNVIPFETQCAMEQFVANHAA